MPIIFDNPAGLWALLGIPALLIIHTLQARARRTRSSTLFLLDRLAPESRGGWQWERLRSSIPLFLQLLTVLVLAWILAAPRWIREDASQQVVVVLDSSLSMDSALDETRAQLPSRLRALAALAMRTEWTLIETDTRAPTLYRGDKLEGITAALAQWEPSLGQHDFAPALQLANSLVRGTGTVILVTDHATDVADGTAVLSFAKPINNCGFVGSTVEHTTNGTRWHALVQNHGTATRTLEWRIKIGERENQPQSLTLAAGETQIIGGALAPDAVDAVVLLTTDAFTLDDQLPLVRPEKKPIKIFVQLEGPENEIIGRILRGIDNIQEVATPAEADLLIARRTPNSPPTTTKPAILFPTASAVGEKLSGWVVTDKHALVANTAWEGLTCSDSAGIQPTAEDTALIWRGHTALAILRLENPRPAMPVLLLNFNPSQTNAPRLPAFVILLRRYIENVRATIPAPFALNADTHQRIPLAYDETKGGLALRVGTITTPISTAQAAIFRAPARPGFFQILHNNEILLNGAAQFSDTREAELSNNTPVDTLAAREKSIAHATSAPDPYRSFWIALLLALPLVAWIVARSRN